MKTYKSFKTAFIRGLAAVLPALLTIWLLIKIYDFLFEVGQGIHQKLFTPLLNLLYSHLGDHLKDSKFLSILAFLLSIVAIYFIGNLLLSLIGRRIWDAAEQHLTRLPFVRLIYPLFKQVTDFFLADKKKVEFGAVCAVEYPRKGIWSLGFVTGPGLKALEEACGRRMLTVFVPNSPTPLTGYTIYLPADEVLILSITVDQMVKVIMSGGVVFPLDAVSPESIQKIPLVPKAGE